MHHAIIFGLVSLLGCRTMPPPASKAPAQPPTTRYSPARIAELIYAEDDNPVRFCVSSAVRTQFGLAAMKAGRATPQGVHDALVGSLEDPRLVARREHQFAEWQKKEDPSRVAVVNLEDCLPDAGVEFDFAALATTCFSLGSQPGVFALLSKRDGASSEVAKERQRRVFADSGLKEPLLMGVVNAVYRAEDDDQEFRVLEKLFGGCLSALSGPSGGAMARKEADGRAVESLAAVPKAQREASGLVFIPGTDGTGAQPWANDRVTVHYVGKLTDDTVFDSSRARGRPATFPLDKVIPCWTEGVQKMKVGGKAKLICPSRIAYGDDGRPPVIPGGATLIFDVELLEVARAAK